VGVHRHEEGVRLDDHLPHLVRLHGEGGRVVLDDALGVVGVEAEQLPQRDRVAAARVVHQLEVDAAARGGQALGLRPGRPRPREPEPGGEPADGGQTPLECQSAGDRPE
jgi:hypothetical protein